MRSFYIAARDGTGFEVRTLEEMESRLSEGYSILEVNGDAETIIATPEAGWTGAKPSPEGPKICKSKAATDESLATALNILVYGEGADHGDTDSGA